MAGFGGPQSVANADVRGTNLAVNAREPWTPATIQVDGKQVDIQWAGRVDGDRLAGLKIKEAGSQNTLIATPNAAGSKLEVMSPTGAVYSRDNNHVYSPQHVAGTSPPAASDFTRGAALMNALIGDTQYKSTLAGAGITNGNFQVVPDAREVRPAPAAPALRQ